MEQESTIQLPIASPKLQVISLHYLPSIPHLAFWLQHENALIEAHENFEKASGRNRCYIIGANGKLRLSIPIAGGRNTQHLYSHTLISYTENWPRKHWQAIRSAYGRAPFFEHYASSLESLYALRTATLYQWNLQLMQWLLQQWGIVKPLIFTDEYASAAAYALDIRDEFTLSVTASPYPQTFAEKFPFTIWVSAIDLLFNYGPLGKNYLYAIEFH